MRCVCESVSVTQQMCPDVSRLRVDSKDAPEAGAKGRHRRPVPVEKEVVVLQPVGEHIMRYDPPPSLPHLVGRSRRQNHLRTKSGLKSGERVRVK